MNEELLVVPYDPAWAVLFEEETLRLRRLIGEPLLELHHVGSTAVPGLAAKPILDVMGVVREITALDPLRAVFESGGWEWKGEFGIPGRRYLVKRDLQGIRSAHLHLFPSEHPEIARHLLFRDRLRARPEVAVEYARLKRDLAVRFRHDREGYSGAKHAFIHSVLDLA